MSRFTSRPGHLLKYLGLAIAVQVIVGLILVVSTLVQTDTNTIDLPLKMWKRTTPPAPTPGQRNIQVLDRPHPLNRLPQNIREETVTEFQQRKQSKPSVSRSDDTPNVQHPPSNNARKKRPDLRGLEPIKLVQYAGGRGEGPVKNCDIPCVHSSDRSDASINTAAAIIYHIPSFGGSPRGALNGRGAQALTVAISMESSEYYRRQKDLSDYDLTITYSFDSDLPVTYYGWDYNLLKDVSEWPWERREPAIVFVARNCHSRNRRENLVKLLQKYVRVDSVSSCMNNHQWPPDIPRSNKDALQMRYLMYLAAENSAEKDYVTEKVYGGLINGAVPIYLGAPNIEEFVPTHSVIPVPIDFNETDVIRIAEIAKNIFTNKTVYEEWIEFKKHPYEERFERKFSISRTHIWCRLCRKLYAMKNGYGWDHELQEIIFD